MIKGIHPGLILGRELKARSMARGRFAISIGEFPQTLGAVIGGKRRMNTALALKIEEALAIEEGYFMTLQVFYDIKCEKQRRQATPDLSKLRTALFWDTDISSIDWQAYKEAVIRRVFERGNAQEQTEIRRFYTDKEVDRVLAIQSQNRYIIHKHSTNEATL